MIDVALVTCARFPELDRDSRLVVPALDAQGLTAEVVIWNDAAVDWRRYRMALVRSTWDYETQRDRFVAWAEQAGRLTRLWNPPHILRWNTDKRYLLDMARHGIPIVPTVYIEKGGRLPFEFLASIWGVSRVVVKPAVSAGARNTWVVEGVTDEVRWLLTTRDILVQPFLDSVASRGEISVFFFGGELSHAVRKRPQAGDFRVQEEHGGTFAPWTPRDAEVTLARRVLHALPAPVLYARIDLMYSDDGEPLLSEAEVTEPSLYHSVVPDSAQALARAVAHTLAVQVP